MDYEYKDGKIKVVDSFEVEYSSAQLFSELSSLDSTINELKSELKRLENKKDKLEKFISKNKFVTPIVVEK